MELIANKDFFDVATGHRHAGEVFIEPRVRVARQLLRSGLAVEAGPPIPIRYEVKVITPEVKAEAAPFRDVPPADPEPAALAALRAAVCAVPDVQPEGDPGGLGRRERGGSDPSDSEALTPTGKTDNRGKAKRRLRGGTR